MPISVTTKALKILQKPVHRLVKRFKKTEYIEDRPRSGRPRTTKTPALGNIAKQKIQRNPQISIRKLAKGHKVARKFTRWLVKEDRQLKNIQNGERKPSHGQKKEVRAQKVQDDKVPMSQRRPEPNSLY